ncbi:MAG: hypothetical protein HRT55_19760 [Colwellia sp.]|uniref:hypothetical protein n=1 Tax=Colwellia sp. TaxID=56799 RepID=UPI0025BED207|nr:hypothetical protein [Colwellia sp.]NQZ28541.1 hypothetical protein [Colwellia sp.]
MTARRIKFSILFIILITCLTTFLLNFTDGASIQASPNIEVSSATNQTLKTPVNAEEIISTAIVTAIEGTDTQKGQMVVMHRPNWKFAENLVVQLEKLISAAENGDNEASYILSMNLRYCFSSPIDDIALEQKLEQVYEFSDSEVAVARITEKYQYCAGIEQKQRTQFYSYSAAAANNGYVAAQEVIGRTTAEFFMESQGYQDLEREEFIIMRDNFIEQKVGFLERAAQHGSISALARLSGMNRSQKLGGNGYAKSFAFNHLILELTQSNKTYDRYSRYQQKLHSQLTSEEIENAFAMSAEWLAIIKANGTLYSIGN